MKQLQLNVKSALAGLINRNADIILIADPDLIPAGIGFPCIGIKDGQVRISELMGNVKEKELPIEIWYFDRLSSGDDCITDFLALGESISARLSDNNFDGYVKGVSPTTETPIKTLLTKQGAILRRGLMFEYEREE